MDVQLQELVDKIKKDGVESAEAMAADIVKNANEKAASIIADAKHEAERIVAKADEESARLEKAAEAAIRQSGRNILILFRESIQTQLSALVRRETDAAYSADVLASLIPSAVTEWIKSAGSNDLSVMLNETDLKKLENTLSGALRKEMANGLELKIDASLSGGFRIGTRDGSAYYDFSAEAVADLFAAYLNPRISSILVSAAGEL